MNELAQVRSHAIPGGCVVTVVGEVDLSNAKAVFDRVLSLVPPEATLVVLDLSATDYLDSSGIALVFRLADRLRVGRQELRLVVPTAAAIRAVLDITAVDQVVPVHASLAEAVPPSG